MKYKTNLQLNKTTSLTYINHTRNAKFINNVKLQLDETKVPKYLKNKVNHERQQRTDNLNMSQKFNSFVNSEEVQFSTSL